MRVASKHEPRVHEVTEAIWLLLKPYLGVAHRTRQLRQGLQRHHVCIDEQVQRARWRVWWEEALLFQQLSKERQPRAHVSPEVSG